MKGWLLCAASLLSVLGCESTVEVNQPSPVMGAEEYFAALARGECGRAVTCGDIGASELDECVGSRINSHAARRYGETTLGQAVVSGRTTINRAAVEECLRVFQWSCQFGAGWWCPKEFTGLLPIASPCHDTIECAGGWCGGGSTCAELSCQPLSQEGEWCGGVHPCAPGQECDSKAYRCKPALTVGDECDPELSLCGDGLWCSPKEPLGKDSFHCTPLPSEGMPCTWGTWLCAAGLFCDHPPGICARPRRQGESCQAPWECANGLTCDGPLDVCVPWSWSDLGMPCGKEVHSTCPDDMDCDEATRTCMLRSYKAVGDDCSEHLFCAPAPFWRQPYLYCDDATRTCQPLADLGEACGVAAPSPFSFPDWTCVNGACDPVTGRCVAWCDL